MMGERQSDQPEMFYGFSLERHVPADHLLRSIDRFAARFRQSATQMRKHVLSSVPLTATPNVAKPTTRPVLGNRPGTSHRARGA